MAKIVIEIDTELSTHKVTIDGNEIPSVVGAGINCYRDMEGDSQMQSVCITTRDEMTPGVMRTTEYYSSGCPEAEAALASGNSVQSKLPGFVAVAKKNKVQEDIAKYFLMKHK